jgi:hypothetical protein
MPRRSDIWRIGLVAAPIEAVAAGGIAPDATVRWLPEEPAYTFLADPFGLWRDGRLHLFAEAYDYRTRHGVIDLVEMDPDDLAPMRRRTVLREPWHLSYPQMFEVEGETWMAPEAHRSGRLTLYRAQPFPDVWEPAVQVELDVPPVDATVFRHGDLWWIAYAPSGPQSFKQGRLHLAFAERLAGPWRTHPGNPVRIDRTSSRPGGAPFRLGGRLVLPTQDCSRTYGGAVSLLHIHELTPERFDAEMLGRIEPPPQAGVYRDGLHTLSACGQLTLIDVKRIDRSPRGLLIDLQRRLRAR